MQSFDTEPEQPPTNDAAQSISVASITELGSGSCVLAELPDGRELAVFNVSGEYYAIDNSCPHRGASLADGRVCDYVVECAWHGWEFDLRTGECLTVTERIKTYEVQVEDGIVRVII